MTEIPLIPAPYQQPRPVPAGDSGRRLWVTDSLDRVAVCTESLDASAAAFADIHTQLVELRAWLRSIERPGRAAHLHCPGGARTLEALLDEADQHLATAIVAAAVIGRNLDSASCAYAEAEETARTNFAYLGVLTFSSISGPAWQAATAGLVPRANGPWGITWPIDPFGYVGPSSRTDWMQLGLGAIAARLLGPVRFLTGSSGAIAFLGKALGAVLNPITMHGRTVTATPLAGHQDVPIDPVDSLAGAARAIGQLDPRDNPEMEPCTIAIDTLVLEDGTRAHAIWVPGTQSADIGIGSNPLDMLGNINAVAGTPSALTAGILAAMQQAGIKPGEPVVIGGHSQGGMVAAAATNDPDFQDRYNLKAVLAFGTAIDGHKGESPTPILKINDGRDLVPGLDGSPSGRKSNVVGVTYFGDNDNPDPTFPGAFGGHHHIDNYAFIGGLADSNVTDWAINYWRIQAGEVLNADVVDAPPHYVLRREDPPPTPLPVPAAGGHTSAPSVPPSPSSSSPTPSGTSDAGPSPAPSASIRPDLVRPQ